VGQLGISDSSVWDPERGYAGLFLAVLAAVLMWRLVNPSTARILQSAASPRLQPDLPVPASNVAIGCDAWPVNRVLSGGKHL